MQGDKCLYAVVTICAITVDRKLDLKKHFDPCDLKNEVKLEVSL